MEKEIKEVSWSDVLNLIKKKKRLIGCTFVITLLIAVPLIWTVPRYYMVEVKLAPELSVGAKATGGTLSSLMNTFGLATGNTGGDDAISVPLYPDLMNSKTFLVSLFDVPVKSQDGTVNTTYYDYLDKHQKKNALSEFVGSISRLMPPEPQNLKTSKAPNAKALTKEQSLIATAITNNVHCGVDIKTGVITIDVKDQDPEICCAVADSACGRLQEFIKEYRSKKARREMQDAERQYNQSRQDYEQAKDIVEGFNSSHRNIDDPGALIWQQDLTNKMQLAYQTMTAFKNQWIAARTKYQSSLPVFTVLDGASVPVKPAGPSRSLYLLGILFVVMTIELCVILFCPTHNS